MGWRMGGRIFKDFQTLSHSGLEVPSALLDATEEREERGEAWEVHLCRRSGREFWTLVLLEDGEAVQWQDGEGAAGRWVPDRMAVRLDEEDRKGLYSLEGRPLPEDVWNEEDGGPDYLPAFGRAIVRDASGGLLPFGSEDPPLLEEEE